MRPAIRSWRSLRWWARCRCSCAKPARPRTIRRGRSRRWTWPTERARTARRNSPPSWSRVSPKIRCRSISTACRSRAATTTNTMRMRIRRRFRRRRWRTNEGSEANETVVGWDGSSGTTSSGGEADVNSQYQDQDSVAGGGRLHRDGTTIIRALKRRSGAVLAAALMATMAPLTIAAHAQQRTAVLGATRANPVSVTLGKSQDVQTEQSIADIVVGDPSVADVNPLTDHRLSIFGKKSGTTRVTVYGADKRPVGIFDIEVGFDISPLVSDI